MGDDNDYGSYQVLANLSIVIDEIGSTSGYKRVLDLETGVHTTSFKAGGASYTAMTYCSYPDDVCMYHLSSSHALPSVSVSMEQVQENASLVSTSCSNGQVRLTGTTEVDPDFNPDIGMRFKSITRIVGGQIDPNCSESTLNTVKSGQKELVLVVAAGTNYDEPHGTAAYNYSFRGVDPGPYVQKTVNVAVAKSAQQLLSAHISDYSALANAFTLNLPDTANSAGVETAELIARYANPNSTSKGDPFLESLVFDYGRHLFISSGRDNSLPPNLQGKWATALENAWSADYHADINLQMNNWPVDQTGLVVLQAGLWDYIAETWAPRGAETAKLLYDAPGWVVHDEINIFGYSAMKTGDDYWADYPASAAWMMQHGM